MKSENINMLMEFWKDFQNKVTFTIKDLEQLTIKMEHAMESIRQLEVSRDNWKKKYEELNKYIKDNTLVKQ